MFSCPSAILFFVIAVAGVATALPSGIEARNGRSSNICNLGSVQCCESIQSSSSSAIIELFALLGIPLPAAGTQIGLMCFPIPIVLSGATSTGSSCTQQTACCAGDNSYGVSIGCSPIDISS